jgi:hypothetical protein
VRVPPFSHGGGRPSLPALSGGPRPPCVICAIARRCGPEPAWHRRLRARRQTARVLLYCCRHAKVLAAHHSMPRFPPGKRSNEAAKDEEECSPTSQAEEEHSPDQHTSNSSRVKAAQAAYDPIDLQPEEERWDDPAALRTLERAKPNKPPCMPSMNAAIWYHGKRYKRGESCRQGSCRVSRATLLQDWPGRQAEEQGQGSRKGQEVQRQ